MSLLKKRIRFELTTWTSLAFSLALLEGGVVGVLIKNGFDGTVSPWLLNFCVAIATGAPFYSNLVSFIWVKYTQGKSKAQFISNLCILCCLSTIGISQVAFTQFGLVALVVLLVVARVSWSGILTIRSAVWRDNYPRYIRGKVTAQLATLSSLLMSITALAAGWVLDWQIAAFTWLYVGLGTLSLFGAWRYRYLSIRHQKRRLETEQADKQTTSFIRMFSLLKHNRPFGKYMLAMFTLGSGNIMLMAPLIVFLSEQTELSRTFQVMITTTLPLAMIPFAVAWWANILDKSHIFRFRAIHSWGFVLALICFNTALITASPPMFFAGAIFYGIALSGGVIGWNLGHNDFVGKARPMDFMAIHVTLTGIRGLIAPLVGISFYQWLETINPGNGKYSLLLPLSITTLGGVLFVIYDGQRVRGTL